MSKKLTIKDLIARKAALKDRKQRKQSLYIESLDAEITIQEPDREVAIEGLEMSQEGKSGEADIHVAYNCVVEPNLKSAELQKEFGCVEPTDIVSIIFRPGEIGAIAGFALEMAGYGGGVNKVDSELKN